jgi:hypothetical protein
LQDIDMVGRISPLRLVLMLVAALGPASCGRGSSANHFRLTGEACDDWNKAAAQVLQGDPSKNGCGMTNPTAQEIAAAKAYLIQANADHVNSEGGCWGTLGFDPEESPREVDHANCGIGSSGGSEIDIVPGDVCSKVGAPTALPTAEAGTPEAGTPPPTPKPDAGTADGGVAEADAPLPEAETPEGGPPEAGAPEVVPDEGGPEVTPDAGGPETVDARPIRPPQRDPLAQQRDNLRGAITEAGRWVTLLQSNHLQSQATSLQQKIDNANRILREGPNSELGSSERGLRSAIATARHDLGM